MKRFLLFFFLVFGMINMVTAQIGVHFNEVRANSQGNPDLIEFIELIGPATTSLLNFQVAHYNGDGVIDGAVWTVTLGNVTIPDDGDTDENGNAIGYYVLGPSLGVANVDESTGWTNDRLVNSDGGLFLIDAGGNIIDAIAWSSAGDLGDDNPDGAGGVVTTGSTKAGNYLHVTAGPTGNDRGISAPDDVLGNDGSGWGANTIVTPGALNGPQTSGSIVLPVELTAFYGKALETQIYLQWETAKEENNSHFTVERSLDTKTFKAIGQVQGRGTTDVAQAYTFSDKSPKRGNNYYRLKQVDYDGQFEYSELIVVNWDNKEFTTIDVFPNPIKDVLNYQLLDLESIEQIQLFDLQGRLLRTTSTFDGTISMKGMVEGTYLLVIDTQTERFRQMVIKQ